MSCIEKLKSELFEAKRNLIQAKIENNDIRGQLDGLSCKIKSLQADASKRKIVKKKNAGSLLSSITDYKQMILTYEKQQIEIVEKDKGLDNLIQKNKREKDKYESELESEIKQKEKMRYVIKKQNKEISSLRKQLKKQLCKRNKASELIRKNRLQLNKLESSFQKISTKNINTTPDIQNFFKLKQQILKDKFEQLLLEPTEKIKKQNNILLAKQKTTKLMEQEILELKTKILDLEILCDKKNEEMKNLKISYDEKHFEEKLFLISPEIKSLDALLPYCVNLKKKNRRIQKSLNKTKRALKLLEQNNNQEKETKIQKQSTELEFLKKEINNRDSQLKLYEREIKLKNGKIDGYQKIIKTYDMEKSESDREKSNLLRIETLEQSLDESKKRTSELIALHTKYFWLQNDINSLKTRVEKLMIDERKKRKIVSEIEISEKKFGQNEFPIFLKDEKKKGTSVTITDTIAIGENKKDVKKENDSIICID